VVCTFVDVLVPTTLPSTGADTTTPAVIAAVVFLVGLILRVIDTPTAAPTDVSLGCSDASLAAPADPPLPAAGRGVHALAGVVDHSQRAPNRARRRQDSTGWSI
jgi:hypothetical protein